MPPLVTKSSQWVMRKYCEKLFNIDIYICKVTAQRQGISTLSLRTRSVAKSIQQSKLPYVRPLRAQHEGRVNGGPSPQSVRPDRAETRSAEWTLWAVLSIILFSYLWLNSLGLRIISCTNGYNFLSCTRISSLVCASLVRLCHEHYIVLLLQETTSKLS